MISCALFSEFERKGDFLDPELGMKLRKTVLVRQRVFVPVCFAEFRECDRNLVLVCLERKWCATFWGRMRAKMHSKSQSMNETHVIEFGSNDWQPMND